MSRKIKPPFRTHNPPAKTKEPVPEEAATKAQAAAPQPFCHLELGPAETIITFNALQNFFQGQSAVEKDNAQTLRITTDLILALRPAALLAARNFAQNTAPPSLPKSFDNKP